MTRSKASRRRRPPPSRRASRRTPPTRLQRQRRRCGPGGHAAQHAGRDEGAERDEHAVAEVQHVHQAEHQRQARGDDEDDHPHRQAGDGQREPGATLSRSAGSASSQHRDQQRQRPPVEAGSGSAVPLRQPRQWCSVGRAHWCAPSDSPSSRCCSVLVVGQRGHRAACARRGRCPSPRRCRPARVAHHEVLLDQQDGRAAGAFSSRSASIRLLMIAGASPLLGSSISSSCARLDDRARHRQHLLLPARQLAGRVLPELLQRREQAEDPVEPRASSSAGMARAARGQHACFPARSGRRRCPCSRARRRCRARAMSGVGSAVMASAVEARCVPGDARHRPMIVRSVVVLPAPLRPSSIVTSPARHVEVDAVQDVVRADVRVHASRVSKRQTCGSSSALRGGREGVQSCRVSAALGRTPGRPPERPARR